MTLFVAYTFQKKGKKRRSTEEREGGEGVVTWGDERIWRETSAQVSQRSYASPTECKRASGKQLIRGKKSKVKRDGGLVLTTEVMLNKEATDPMEKVKKQEHGKHG